MTSGLRSYSEYIGNQSAMPKDKIVADLKADLDRDLRGLEEAISHEEDSWMHPVPVADFDDDSVPSFNVTSIATNRSHRFWDQNPGVQRMNQQFGVQRMKQQIGVKMMNNMLSGDTSESWSRHIKNNSKTVQVTVATQNNIKDPSPVQPNLVTVQSKAEQEVKQNRDPRLKKTMDAANSDRKDKLSSIKPTVANPKSWDDWDFGDNKKLKQNLVEGKAKLMVLNGAATKALEVMKNVNQSEVKDSSQQVVEMVKKAREALPPCPKAPVTSYDIKSLGRIPKINRNPAAQKGVKMIPFEEIPKETKNSDQEKMPSTSKIEDVLRGIKGASSPKDTHPKKPINRVTPDSNDKTSCDPKPKSQDPIAIEKTVNMSPRDDPVQAKGDSNIVKDVGIEIPKRIFYKSKGKLVYKLVTNNAKKHTTSSSVSNLDVVEDIAPVTAAKSIEIDTNSSDGSNGLLNDHKPEDSSNDELDRKDKIPENGNHKSSDTIQNNKPQAGKESTSSIKGKSDEATNKNFKNFIQEDQQDCSAAKCLKPVEKKGSGPLRVHWVQCDSCELWFHFNCIGLKPEQVSKEREFICNSCEPKSKPLNTPVTGQTDKDPKEVIRKSQLESQVAPNLTKEKEKTKESASEITISKIEGPKKPLFANKPYVLEVKKKLDAWLNGEDSGKWKIKEHQCAICSEKILHSRSAITQHMMVKHNKMGLPTYFVKNILNKKVTKKIEPVSSNSDKPVTELPLSHTKIIKVHSKSDTCEESTKTTLNSQTISKGTIEKKEIDKLPVSHAAGENKNENTENLQHSKTSISPAAKKSKVSSDVIKEFEEDDDEEEITTDNLSTGHKENQILDSNVDQMHDIGISGPSVKSEQKEPEPSNNETTEPASVHPSYEWVNACSTDCKICKESFKHLRDLDSHLNLVHKRKLSWYRQKYFSKVFHDCKICGKTMTLIDSSLREHFRRKHNLSIQQYYDQFIGTTNETSLPLSNTDKETASDKHDFPVTAEIILHQESSDQPTPSKFKVFKEIKQEMEHENMANYGSWINACEMRCQYSGCNFFTKDIDQIHHHIKGKHNATSQEFKKEYGSVITKRVIHKCLVDNCGRELMHYRKNLDYHMKTTHKLMLSEYFKKWVTESGVSQTVVVSTPLAEVLTKESENGIQENEPEPIPSYDIWANACEMSCKFVKCSYSTNITNAMYEHIKTHNSSVQEYLKEHQSLITKRVMHKCLVENCGREIKHSSKSLGSHMRNIHSLALPEYFKKYVIVSGTWKTKVFDNQKVKDSKGEGDEAVKIEKEEAREDQITEIQKEPLPKNRGKELPGYESWLNACEFSCRHSQCDFSTKSYCSMYLHLKEHHSEMPPKEYIKQFGSLVTSKTYHKCLIESCSSRVAQHAASLSSHTRKEHGLALREYYKKFVLKSQVGQEKATVNSTKAPTNNTDGIKLKIKLPVKTETETEKSVETDLAAAKWCNKSVFSCNICEEQGEKRFATRRKTKFYSHLMAIHKMTAKSYTAQHGSTIKYRFKHECLICSIPITHTRDGIDSHLKSKHKGLKISKYYVEYVLAQTQQGDTNTKSDPNQLKVEEKSPISVESKGKDDALNHATYQAIKEDTVNAKRKKAAISLQEKRHQVKRPIEGQVDPNEPVSKSRKYTKVEALSIIKQNLSADIKEEKVAPGPVESNLSIVKKELDQPLMVEDFMEVQFQQEPIETEHHPSPMLEKDLIDIKDNFKQELQIDQTWSNKTDEELADEVAEVPEEFRTVFDPKLTVSSESDMSETDVTDILQADSPNQSANGGSNWNNDLSPKMETFADLSEDRTVLTTERDPQTEFSPMSHSTLVGQNTTGHPDTISNAAKDLDNSDPDSWMDGCIYQCKLCGKDPGLFKNRDSFERHLLAEHTVEPAIYISLAGDPLSKKTYFTCKLCQQDIAKDRREVSKHLQEVHRTAPNVYRLLTAQ